MKPTPVLVRLVILAAGAGMLLSIDPLRTVPVVIATIGILLAAALPQRVGASVAIAGLILTWLAATGWHGHPSVGGTVAAAAALYVLYTATGFAAYLPLDARVERRALGLFLARSVPVVIVGAAIIGADYVIGRHSGSPLVELAGLLGVLALVALPAWLGGR